MKARYWIGCGSALCALIVTAGCDVHRTDPIPEVAPVIGTPEKEADRARPAPRESSDAFDVRDRQSRVAMDPSGHASGDENPSAVPTGTKSAAKLEGSHFGVRTSLSAFAEAVDARLASEVESALAAEPALRGSSIAVHSEDGVVTLRGATSDTEDRMLAAHVARAVQGVRLVRNEIAAAGEV